MRKGVHLIIGVLAFFVYAYLTSLIHETATETFIIGLFAVAAGSMMPDILEAPTSWRHRKLFHSKRALKGVMVIFCITTAASLVPPPLMPHPAIVYGLSCFALGYLFHLLADAMTRMGLSRNNTKRCR
jgi:hypothetical protein